MLIRLLLFDLKSRKALEKPVFIVATIALVVMVIALYFASISGVIDSSVAEIISFAGENAPEGTDVEPPGG